MDSCAAEFVIPPGLVNSSVRSSECSRKGRFHGGARGDNTFNEGEQRVQFLSERTKLMAMTFQVAKVRTPLTSLVRITKAGNRIILDSEGSYVVHKESEIKTPLREQQGVFVMRARLGGTWATKDVKHSSFVQKER